MKKMLVSDYDQTFYINDSDIEKNKKSVERFRGKNNLFVIATGRSYYDFNNKLDIYKFKYDYAILNHGANMIDQKNNILYNITIPNEVIPKIKEILEINKAVSYFCCSGKESRLDFNHPDITKINVKYNTKKEAFDKAKKVEAKYGQYVNVYCLMSDSIEIISKKTDKASAIYKVMKENKIDKNNVYTIGDGYSDIEMIKTFNGYCMIDSVEELKNMNIEKVNSVSTLIEKII